MRVEHPGLPLRHGPGSEHLVESSCENVLRSIEDLYTQFVG